MESEQTTGSYLAGGHAAVKTWLSSSTRGATRTPSDTTFRFHGDGVRYKAKLIGVDPVPDFQGEKMCLDSMMKLKGFAAAARAQGKHKQRVWLKVFSTGLKILDERSGAVLHDHERSRISSLTKDESDPRALAYIYQHQDTYSLFYIKMANLADPVLADIKEICQRVDEDVAQEPAEAPTQMLILNENSDPLPEGPGGVFSPRPEFSPGQPSQVSSSDELMEVFSIQRKEPLSPTQSSCSSQPDSPRPSLSSSQILSMFPTQPAGGSPYPSSTYPPPYPPAAMPWGYTGLLESQWAAPAPAPAPWSAMSGSMAAWAPPGVTAASPGGQFEAHGMVTSQPGVMWGIDTPVSPSPANGHPYPINPINSTYAPTGAAGAVQAPPPSVNLLL